MPGFSVITPNVKQSLNTAPDHCVTTAPIPLDPPIVSGDVGSLGGRRFVRLIGKGSTAAVYESVDPDLDRRTAIKVLLPTVNSHRRVRERFLREAKLCAKINHPHVVTVYRSGELTGLPFIEMEIIAGVTLEQYLRSHGVCKIGSVVRFARELLAGLAAVHAAGIIHRDIKPGNIWLAVPNGKVKLLDFGLAHIDEPSTEQLTIFGTILGSPAYMSPEQARGITIDFQSDLFSLGIVLFQMLTGVLPFIGKTPLDVIAEITTKPHRSVRLLNPAVSQELSDLIDQLLEKDPAQRPKSAQDVLNRLFALSPGLSGAKMPNVVPVQKEQTETAEVFATLTEPIIRLNLYRPDRKHPSSPLRPLLYILFGVFFGVAACALVMFQRR